MHGEASLAGPIIRAAQTLSAKGVGKIAGACGSFAYYRRAVADAVPVPVFLSIMMQVPLLQFGLGSQKKLCIVCAAKYSLTDRVFEQCGITDQSSLVIQEVSGRREFDRMIAGDTTLSPSRLCAENVEVCKNAVRSETTIGAFLLQCSDLPPFASEIQAATGRPVFDMTLFIRWLQTASNYRAYS